MNDQELRLKAMQLAAATCGESSKEHVLQTAKAYLAFLKGEDNDR